MNNFVPRDFAVPTGFSSEQFLLEPLSERWADADHRAVLESQARIQHVFGPENDWPLADLSYAENRADIDRHHADFVARRAFTYAVLDSHGGAYMGCLYIKRIKSLSDTDPRKAIFDAQAFFWLQTHCHSDTLDASIFAAIDDWLHTCWPFRRVAFPGRQIRWAEWAQARVDVTAIACRAPSRP